MEARQKRKANVLSAEHYEVAVGAGSGGSGGSAGMHSATGPRRVDGKIVPRHLLVFKAGDKVIHLTAEYTVSMAAIYAEVEKHLGFEVSMHQTIKRKTRMLDRNSRETAEDHMDFGYNINVERAGPVPVARTEDKTWRLIVIDKVLRATESPADEPATEAKPAEEAKKGKEPSAGEGGRSTAAVVKRRLPPPAWAPRGVPGGHFLAQFPIEYDADGNKLPTKYQEVYWHQGM
jgi:hypothetical protein